MSGLSPTAAGFTLMPLMIGAAAGTLMAGRTVESSGSVRIWPIVGSVMMAVGIGLLATVGRDTPPVVVGASDDSEVGGLGLGVTDPI